MERGGKGRVQRRDQSMIRVIANTAEFSADQVDWLREIVRTNGWDDVVMVGRSQRRRKER